MSRKILTGLLTLVLAVVVVGCNRRDTGRPNDMPVNAKQGVDRKGKATKSMEASFEDPKPKR